MPGTFEHLDQFADRDVLLHGDDIGARQHDALDPAFAQPENVLEHGRLFGREAGRGCSAVSTCSRSARVAAAFQPNRMRMTRVSQPCGGSPGCGRTIGRLRCSFSGGSLRVGNCAMVLDFGFRLRVTLRVAIQCLFAAAFAALLPIVQRRRYGSGIASRRSISPSARSIAVASWSRS